MKKRTKIDIPLSWIWSSIGDICSQPQYGYTTKATDNGSLRLLRTTDITSGNIDWASVPFCSTLPDDVEKYLLKDGDIVISRAGSVGVSYLLKNPKKSIFASYLIRFKPYIDKKYFKFFLGSTEYWAAISDNKLGIAIPNVNATKLKTIQLPVPPENEQHRIVAKIEELFSELDKGVESLTTAREQLKLYRQALLKRAFEGKLTEKWRAEHGDQLETVDQLLARIKKEREKYYQQQLTEWEKAVEEWKAKGKEGKRPAKPRKLKVLPEITQKEAGKLPELPANWMWIKIDKTHNHEPNAIKAGPFGSALKKACYVPSGYKIYGQEQVISGNWQFGDYFINEEKYTELENCKVAPNDILISLVGTVGKVLILPDGIQAGVINPRLIKISPNITAYHPVFFKYYFESHFLKDLYKLQTHGATMDVLNLGIIQKLPFPLCSMAEQQEIVNILDLHFSVIEQSETIIDDNLITANLTRQSILKKAFSGRLVPQDSNDEPASELLARIKSEREAAQKEIKKRPRKKRKKKEVKIMATLLEVVRAANDWLSAQDAFRQCGIADGAETNAIEKIYEELRDHVKENRIAVERRGEEDWLRPVLRG